MKKWYWCWYDKDKNRWVNYVNEDSETINKAYEDFLKNEKHKEQELELNWGEKGVKRVFNHIHISFIALAHTLFVFLFRKKRR